MRALPCSSHHLLKSAAPSELGICKSEWAVPKSQRRSVGSVMLQSRGCMNCCMMTKWLRQYSDHQCSTRQKQTIRRDVFLHDQALYTTNSFVDEMMRYPVRCQDHHQRNGSSPCGRIRSCICIPKWATLKPTGPQQACYSVLSELISMTNPLSCRKDLKMHDRGRVQAHPTTHAIPKCEILFSSILFTIHDVTCRAMIIPEVTEHCGRDQRVMQERHSILFPE